MTWFFSGDPNYRDVSTLRCSYHGNDIGFLSADLEVSVNFFRTILLIVLFALNASIAYAALTIEITEGVESAVPVAVVPFASQNAPVNISA
jgi:uncharacterized membrane protein